MRKTAVIAGIALIVGLGGCSSSSESGDGGESASPSAAATSEVPADVTTYTSDQYGFSFQYAPPFEEKSDTTWEAQSEASSADTVAVFDVDGTQVGGQYRDAFVVNTYQLNTEITDENLEQVATELEQSVIPQLEQSTDDMQISELVSTEVNGLKGFQADATFTVEGTPMTSTLYFLFDGDLEFQLLAQSATDRWTELQPTFQTMVDSFQVSADAAASESPAA
ncbi:MAG: hypothetical protein V9E82_14530 [Candidatus Nanopelagicales bacterium]